MLQCTDDIEWPDEKDFPIQPETKDIISATLQQNPRDRLGTGGAHEVKEHPYFMGLNWNSLLRQKAEFVPQLDDEEDTSYFDSMFIGLFTFYVLSYTKVNIVFLFIYLFLNTSYCPLKWQG